MKYPANFHKNWHGLLDHLFNDRRMLKVAKYIQANKDNICPEYNNIFRVFSLNPYDIKVVILGQSPYNNSSAIGYAFAVPDKDHITPSYNIISDAVFDYTMDFGAIYDTTLSHWVDQGVFLLNRHLTVRKNGRHGEHAILWEWFTEGVIKVLSDNFSAIVFNLWGNKAKEIEYLIDKNKHYVIEAIHPAYTARNKSKSYYVPEEQNFSSYNVFEKTDEILYKINKQKIEWSGFTYLTKED